MRTYRKSNLNRTGNDDMYAQMSPKSLKTKNRVMKNSITENRVTKNSITENRIMDNSVMDNSVMDNSVDNSVMDHSVMDHSVMDKSFMNNTRTNLSPIRSIPTQSDSSNTHINHKLVVEHSSFKNNKKYAVMNELVKGSYFGEISILTNLNATASIHTVNNLVCGRLNKQALVNYFSIYTESKQKMIENMYKYNDTFFNALSKSIKNSRYFKNLSNHSAMNLIFKMRRVKYNKDTVVVKDKE
jgi:hypothetical protein